MYLKYTLMEMKYKFYEFIYKIFNFFLQNKRIKDIMET